MNIFVVDRNPITAASMLCDKHVIKMILESAQIMSTVVGGPYKPTHANHPCTLWAKLRMNYQWLAVHALALCEEYTRRYSKVHKSERIIRELSAKCFELPEGQSDFVQCMPDEFKQADPVLAYRAYYHSKQFAVWAHSNKPEWWHGQ